MFRLFQRKKSMVVVKGTADLFESGQHKGMNTEHISKRELKKRQKLAAKEQAKERAIHVQKASATLCYNPVLNLSNSMRLEAKAQADASGQVIRKNKR